MTETNVEGTNHPTIDDLAKDLIAARSAYEKARDHLAVVEQVAVAVLGHKAEGVRHFPGGDFVVSTTGVMNRTLDKESLHRISSNVNAGVLEAVIPRNPSLNVKELKSLATLDPYSYAEICKFITAKPGKTKVTVKELK